MYEASVNVDDNLIFTNSRTFADEFAAHCNKSLKMNREGDLRLASHGGTAGQLRRIRLPFKIPAPANTSVEIDDMQPALIDSDSDEEHMVPAVPEPPMPTGRSTRVRKAPVSFKAPARQTTYQRYNNDGSFRTTIDALVNTKVRKYVPGYGTFQGIITS